jgi:predicted phosphodiesterase/MFS family permease
MDEPRGPHIAPADAATSTPDPAAPAPDGEVTDAGSGGTAPVAGSGGTAADVRPDQATPAAAGRARRVGRALAARLDRHRHRGPGLRRALFALVGAALAVALFGRVPAKVGPFETTMSARPSLNGHTVVQLAPLGTIDLDTHDWPLAITLRVDQIGVADAERLAGNPAAIDRLGDEAADEVRSALMGLVVRCTLVALAGGVAGALAARLSWRSVVVGAAVAGLLVVALGAGAAATFDERAVSEPRYTGLLTRAPTAVGDIEAVIDRFGEYRTQLSELVDNMATLYLAGAELPTFQPDGELIRVLHVSDIHLNPQAFDLIERLTEQFGVDVVADTGDLTDWGTRPEARLVDRIGDLEVPYVYVRGNHDSHSIQAAVTDQPNAVVLDGEATTVAGLRFWGIGDPRYTPDKSVQGEGTEQERALAFAPEAADELADDEPPDVDVAMVHDQRVAADLGGEVPLVLAGHTHDADEGRIEPRDDDADGAEDGTEDGGTEDGGGEDGGGEDGDGEDGGSASTDDSETTGTGDATDDEDGTGDEAGGADEDDTAETLLLVEGSTGGAGLRGLQGEEPEPLAASILYFDPETRELVAYDRITVAWLQDAGATIERHIIGDLPEDDEVDDTGGTGTADTDTESGDGSGTG